MRLKVPQILLSLLIAGTLILNGCSGTEKVSQPVNTATEANSKTTTKAVATTTAVSENISEVPGMNDLPRLEGKATVEMKITGQASPITIEVDGNNAPISAGNFVDLVQKGVYDGLAFHRVIGPQNTPPEDPFVVQGGDPASKDPNVPMNRLGTGGYKDPKTGNERYVPLEITPQGGKEPIYGKTLESAGVSKPPQLSHKLGAVAMARSQMPNTASSQFYFTLAPLNFLDGSYAVFGYVTDGMDVVNKIKQGDRIESAKVVQGGENLKNVQ